MRSPAVRRGLLAGVAALAALGMPAVVAAHPLGNFTFNHYAALRVGPHAIALDVVVDLAEIPAFQERLRIDVDGDGSVSAAEADGAREDECQALLPSLRLEIDGTPLDLVLEAAGLSFPAGAGGVPTMRIVCELRAEPGPSFGEAAGVTFADASDSDRLGWREIVVIGNGATISGLDGDPPPAAEDASARLTAYPAELLSKPLAVRSARFSVSPGGTAAPPFVAPDATAVTTRVTAPDAAPSPADDGTASDPPGAPAAPAPLATVPARTPMEAAVPGGVAAEIPDLFRVADLSPIVALGSIALAMALGAGHALTPGHGKTLMAAYLVGTRGTVRQAAGLGLAVTVSHTLGILLLALLAAGAEVALPADVVVRTVPTVAALAFVAVGASMLAGELRRRRAGAHSAGGAEHDHARSHRAPDSALDRRQLLLLGLAGGIVPSTSALIILLGAVVAGRAAFGIVLVVAFGLGMALVLGGVGAVMVLARERLERLPSPSRLTFVAGQAPIVASIAVLGIGLWLTAQALAGIAIL